MWIFKELMLFIAYYLIFVAIDYKRPKKHILQLFSKGWWVQVILITIAILIINQYC